ncbi:MAG: hypothetical protein IPH98_11210 [Saprospiraceae bacterium]|nr:hypothetical protein [Candidatus Defluviibacterium haderslevense]
MFKRLSLALFFLMNRFNNIIQNKFSFYLISLMFLFYNSFTKARKHFPWSGIYPNILLKDLQIVKISGLKLTYRFKVQNQTKNSVNLNEIYITTEKEIISQATTDFNRSLSEYSEIFSGLLSDDHYKISNKPLSMIPRQTLTVNITVDSRDLEPTAGLCPFLKVTILEYPNPMTLPNFYLKKIIKTNRSTCDD